MNNSFGPHQKLKSKSDFDYLKDGSDALKFRSLRAYFKVSKINNDYSRIGLSVSKKVGNSPRRNRIKRILREYFRLNPIRTLGKDILIVVSPYLFQNFSDVLLAEKALLDDMKKLTYKLTHETK